MMKGTVARLLSSALIWLAVSCGAGDGPSSSSVEHARRRGVLLATYAIPAEAMIGEYRAIEVWVERNDDPKGAQLVVRLQGPHVDKEPRVMIDGFTREQYRSIWSERGGPPYEVWTVDGPIPKRLVLRRGEQEIGLRRSDG